MAFSFKICRCRLDLHSLLHTTNRATGNLQRRNAVRWGWMKTRAAQKSDAALQSLVDFCCANIADNQDRLGAASEAELIRLLEDVPVQALGFHEGIISQPNEGSMGSTSVSYMHVAEKKGCFSMGVFLFKDGANLPLHDHPSMSVYSRTLFGTIDAQSYDWLAGPPPPGGAASARLAATHRMEAGSVSALYADAGNVHSFAARSPAAVFDVLVPGYCYGRRCSYFARAGGGGAEEELQDAPGIGPSVLSTPYRGYLPTTS